jgi:hypothetical protein
MTGLLAFIAQAGIILHTAVKHDRDQISFKRASRAGTLAINPAGRLPLQVVEAG